MSLFKKSYVTTMFKVIVANLSRKTTESMPHWFWCNAVVHNKYLPFRSERRRWRSRHWRGRRSTGHPHQNHVSTAPGWKRESLRSVLHSVTPHFCVSFLCVFDSSLSSFFFLSSSSSSSSSSSTSSSSYCLYFLFCYPELALCSLQNIEVQELTSLK